MQYIVRMLCAGIVHGDLSEFNVLVDDYGPVIIDLPQAVYAASNNNAEAMLERDVNNMKNYYGMFAPELLKTQYAKEIWMLFEQGELEPDCNLTGYVEENTDTTDIDNVLVEIKAALEEEDAKQERLREAQLPEE